MGAELMPRITPGPYDPQYSSVILDIVEETPVVVALREDVAAFAVDNDIVGHQQATGAVYSLFCGMPFTRVSVGCIKTDNFAHGRVLETSRSRVLHPDRTFGIRLECMDVVLTMIDEQTNGGTHRFNRFSTRSAELIHSFARAVLL